MKNLNRELQEIKFLFGYERGRVISEQANLPMDEKEMDMMFSDTEVMEPEIAPDIAPDIATPEVNPEETKRERTFNPSRLPHPYPDTHPQGRKKDKIKNELELDYTHPQEVEYELELDDKHFGDGNEKMFTAKMKDDEKGGDPFTQDVDTDTDSLEAMVRKYLRSKK